MSIDTIKIRNGDYDDLFITYDEEEDEYIIKSGREGVSTILLCADSVPLFIGAFDKFKAEFKETGSE